MNRTAASIISQKSFITKEILQQLYSEMNRF